MQLRQSAWLVSQFGIKANPRSRRSARIFLRSHFSTRSTGRSAPVDGCFRHARLEAEIIETSSNARSAELAAKEPGTAAIAGALAAEKYGLTILEQDIQDNAANATRFLVLGHQCSPPTGNDRTSIMVSIADKVGALHHALAAFRRSRINLTKIESRPSKRKAWEYYFFIDCDGHQHDRKVAQAIELLGKECSYVKVLGSYPNSE